MSAVGIGCEYVPRVTPGARIGHLTLIAQWRLNSMRQQTCAGRP